MTAAALSLSVPSAAAGWPYPSAARLCAEVSRGSVTPPCESTSGPFEWATRLFRKPDPAAELDRHRAELAADPRDPLALWRLARTFDRLKYPDLAAVVLSALHKLRPDDPAPAAALARWFLAQAQRTDRNIADRLKDCDRCVRYADRAAATRPSDELRDVRTAAAVETTLLKGQYHV